MMRYVKARTDPGEREREKGSSYGHRVEWLRTVGAGRGGVPSLSNGDVMVQETGSVRTPQSGACFLQSLERVPKKP